MTDQPIVIQIDGTEVWRVLHAARTRWVGEPGPEVTDLPPGTRIEPHPDSDEES